MRFSFHTHLPPLPQLLGLLAQPPCPTLPFVPQPSEAGQTRPIISPKTCHIVCGPFLARSLHAGCLPYTSSPMILCVYFEARIAPFHALVSPSRLSDVLHALRRRPTSPPAVLPRLQAQCPPRRSPPKWRNDTFSCKKITKYSFSSKNRYTFVLSR